MITTPLETKTFYDIREVVRYYNITPINPEKWNGLAGEEDFEEYYELYHPNVSFDSWRDIYELELGKIQDRHFMCFEGKASRLFHPIYVVELPMPIKREDTMKYAIHVYEDTDCDFDLITEEGHLYGFYNAERYPGEKGTICERRFTLNKNLLYNPEDAWDLTSDFKEYATLLPEQTNLEEAISLVLEHIGAENPERVSIDEINSIISKIEDTI